jgi:RHS repeat-associated protein
LAGLDEVVFPTTTDNGQSYDLDGAANATQAHGYDFAQADNFGGSVDVVVSDRAGNETSESFSVVNDTVAPTAAITVPERAGLSFVVEWSGNDSESGVQHYEVEYKEDEGAWTEWLTGTTAVKATFAGTQGISYTFQVRASDNVGNVSGWEESEVVEISDTVTKYYSFGGQRVAMRRGAEVYYLHGDHLGSTSLTSDSAGAVVAESRYLPYGQERWSNGAGVTDFGFTSQRADSGFGLLDYNARYYSATLGRFISPDSIVPDPTSSGGFNRYRYTRNNPCKYTDPSGHCIVGYSGSDEGVRMNQGPYGTSGICPNTEHPILEAHAAIEEYHKSLPPPSPPIADAQSLHIPANLGQVSGFAPSGGFDLVYNNHSRDLTLFAIAGAQGTLGAEVSIKGQYNLIFNIGDDNLNYSGQFVFGNLTGANVLGFTGGGAYTPMQGGDNIFEYYQPNWQKAHSVGIGPAVGAGVAGTGGVVYYYPLFTLTHDGKFISHHEEAAEIMSDPFLDAIEMLIEHVGVNPDDYDLNRFNQP